MKVRVGVAGAGGIARFHFRGFAAAGAEVKIVADPNREAARAHAGPFGAAVASDWRDVVGHPEVDAVVVLLPSPMHREVVAAALERGKHVVCEKTLTLSGADSLALARTAESRGLLLFTSYMKRFFPAVEKAKELVPSLGHLMSVYARTWQGVAPHDLHTGTIPPPWALPPGGGASRLMGMSGGGILVCGGSHVCDLLLHLAGKPRRVYARQFRRPGSDLDLMTHAVLDLDGGGVAHFEGNWHPLARVGFLRRGWEEVLEISGVRGRLVVETPVWNEPEHAAARLRHYDNEAGTWTEFAFERACPFARAERHFLAQIAKGEQGPHDRYVGYRADCLLEATQRSATEDRPVDLAWEA